MVGSQVCSEAEGVERAISDRARTNESPSVIVFSHCGHCNHRITLFALEENIAAAQVRHPAMTRGSSGSIPGDGTGVP